jgi:putative oxidoreductase
LYHGIPKLLHFGATAGFFAYTNVPAPTLVAAYATVVEVFGGLLLLLGIATDIAGLLVVLSGPGASAVGTR